MQNFISKDSKEVEKNERNEKNISWPGDVLMRNLGLFEKSSQLPHCSQKLIYRFQR